MNPLMIDGTGMCGGCRVKVGDEYLHACVDGPDFDGHLVDYDDAMRRGVMYRSASRRLPARSKRVAWQAKAATAAGRLRPRRPKARGRGPSMARLNYEAEQAEDEGSHAGARSGRARADVRRGGARLLRRGGGARGAPLHPVPRTRRAWEAARWACPSRASSSRWPQGNFARAYAIVKSANALPAICGRVCPQESQCEGRVHAR